MATKVGEVIKRLRAEGWVITNQVGRHRQFEHPT